MSREKNKTKQEPPRHPGSSPGQAPNTKKIYDKKRIKKIVAENTDKSLYSGHYPMYSANSAFFLTSDYFSTFLPFNPFTPGFSRAYLTRERMN